MTGVTLRCQYCRRMALASASAAWGPSRRAGRSTVGVGQVVVGASDHQHVCLAHELRRPDEWTDHRRAARKDRARRQRGGGHRGPIVRLGEGSRWAFYGTEIDSVSGQGSEVRRVEHHMAGTGGEHAIAGIADRIDVKDIAEHASHHPAGPVPSWSAPR
jgi:hypothetical protein